MLLCLLFVVFPLFVRRLLSSRSLLTPSSHCFKQTSLVLLRRRRRRHHGRDFTTRGQQPRIYMD